jgi:hypothetical protein
VITPSCATSSLRRINELNTTTVYTLDNLPCQSPVLLSVGASGSGIQCVAPDIFANDTEQDPTRVSLLETRIGHARICFQGLSIASSIGCHWSLVISHSPVVDSRVPINMRMDFSYLGFRLSLPECL